MMELREFVRETLVQIVRGVQEAQNSLEDTNAEISPTGLRFTRPEGTPVVYKEGRGIVQHVDFDVAVTTSEGTSGRGGLGVFITDTLGVGAQLKRETETSAVNRIKFLVPVLFPSEPHDWSGESQPNP